MAVARDDHVDAIHLPGKLRVLPRPLGGARVGEDDHIAAPLHPAQVVHRLGRPGCPVGKGCRRGGDAGGGVVPHEAHHADFDPFPLKDRPGRRPHGLQPPGELLRPLLHSEVAGHQGGNGVPAVRRRLEHVPQGGIPQVELMVAQGDGIVPHGPQGPQLRGLLGVEGIHQSAHGEVPGVHREDGPLRPGPLLLQHRRQPGEPPGGFPILPRRGGKLAVDVVGEKDSKLRHAPLRPGGGGGGGQGEQQGRRSHQGQGTEGESQDLHILFCPGVREICHSGPGVV